MNYNPALVNNRLYKEHSKGNLLKADKGTIIKMPFQYSIEKPRMFSTMTSAMPGLEYISPSEVIKTSRLDLSFAKDDKIQLQDGRIMTVDETAYDSNKDRAMVNGGRMRWILSLKGG